MTSQGWGQRLLAVKELQRKIPSVGRSDNSCPLCSPLTYLGSDVGVEARNLAELPLPGHVCISNSLSFFWLFCSWYLVPTDLPDLC